MRFFLKKEWIFCCVICLFPWMAEAKPYFAVRHGYKCSQCHINKTGGGKRNAFGVIYAQSMLPMKKTFYDEDEKTEKPFPFFNHALNEFISAGANLRLDNKTVYKKGDNKGKEENTFTFSEGNLYLETALIKDWLSLYFDENFAPGGVSSREAFGIWNNLPWNGYIKAGRFMLPYGFRVLDDTAFIRSRTNINYDEQDYGLEIGFEPGFFSGNLALTNGTSGSDDDNTNKQLTSRAELAFRHFRFGPSVAVNRSSTNKRRMAGLFLGWNFWKLSWLGEFDYIVDKNFSEVPLVQTDQRVFFSQLNFLLMEGLNIQWGYEYLDSDISVSDDSRIRVSGGIEPYFTPFLQGSLFYRYHKGPPQRPAESEDELIAQIHLFF